MWGISKLEYWSAQQSEDKRAKTEEALSGARGALINYALLQPPVQALAVGEIGRYNAIFTSEVRPLFFSGVPFRYFMLPCPDGGHRWFRPDSL